MYIELRKPTNKKNTHGPTTHFKKYKNWTTICKRLELDHFLTHVKINSKWTKDLNLRLETIKLPKENTSSKFLDIRLSNILFGYVFSGKGNNSKTNQ